MDWSFPPDLQNRYDEILANIRRLQAEFGITPMSLDERHRAYLKRKQEEEEFKKILATRRPLPKWKV
jgi:hypothetical protein